MPPNSHLLRSASATARNGKLNRKAYNVGIRRQVKLHEYLVGMTPSGVAELTDRGIRVLVEAGSGVGSRFGDDDYRMVGATIMDENSALYAEADIVVKVKEPQTGEYAKMRPGQIVFTYFHFAADEVLTRNAIESGITALAYETVTDKGILPLLTPMSEVAGRMSIQAGAKLLERPNVGCGVLLSGVPGLAPADVVVLGGGVVGTNAARVAAGQGDPAGSQKRRIGVQIMTWKDRGNRNA